MENKGQFKSEGKGLLKAGSLLKVEKRLKTENNQSSGKQLAKQNKTLLQKATLTTTLSKIQSKNSSNHSKESRKEDTSSKTITYENLSIPSFELLHIEEFKLEQKVNHHAELNFSGRLPEGMEDSVVYYTTVGYQVEVFNIDEEKKEIIFCGMVTDVRVTNESGIKHLEVSAISNTYMMDTYKVSKSYQNTGMSYKDLINGVVKNTQNAKVILSEETNASLGEFVLQYKETDWEFIKRMASRFHLGLFPEITSGNPRFYVGASEGKAAKEIDILEYTAQKNLKEYQINQKNYISGINESDYITYTIKSNELMRLGDKVLFNQSEYYIKEAVYQMVKGVVIGTYHICKKNGLKQKKYHNKDIVGISLNGSVVSVQRDKVQIQLAIDGGSNCSYYFPYSTMSASPDGSGWYCMPEQGDQIRVYFPNETEKDCYAISSVSSYTPTTGDTSDKMSDPSVKYLRTADNKEIMLTPSGIVINADDGKAVITLDNEGNITINGAKSINVTAENDVNITASRNINLYASENISFGGQSGTIVMEKSGDTKLTGDYILEN